eukprot:NODE_12447_length_1224_cov_3.440292.p1 GENE.NODE_12447_length_1224_cov_3.440292~~NODE_12447_length_1224_cov_3.440292.p1  ORF type:complete len:380 (+),score=70.21 NODE_12447_length_1224_cov_3.440292:70-1140(+)
MVLWVGVLYMRLQLGLVIAPLLLHIVVMGAGYSGLGLNEIHYHAHKQVSTIQTSHVFKPEPLNAFVTWVLQGAMGFSPGFWLHNHVRIHHKENNGHNDIQTVSFFPRSPDNFFYFGCEIPLQWHVRVALHFWSKKDRATALKVMAGSIVQLGGGALLTLHDPLAAFLTLWLPLAQRMTVNAANEYVQHAYVDQSAPFSIPRNTWVIVKPTPTAKMDQLFPAGVVPSHNWAERLHAVHHLYPTMRSSEQWVHFQEHYATFQKQRHIMFDIAESAYEKFLLATICHDIDGLAEMLVLDATKEEKVEEIKSLLGAAYPREACGTWATLPPWPFSAMSYDVTPRSKPVLLWRIPIEHFYQ